MPTPNFKTVRLERGKHRGPDDGACVMELASMIAGEPFTDRPRSVCPVIAGLLRPYNDVAGRRRRQDMLRCAADVVGTRTGVAVEALRLDHCLEVLEEIEALRSRSLLWRVRTPTPSRLAELLETPNVAGGPIEQFLSGLARLLHAGGMRGHDRALALVDELVAIRAANDVPASVDPDESALVAHAPETERCG